MQQTNEPENGRDEKTEAERDRLASNLAFLIVQAVRRDQQSGDASTNAPTDSDR